MGTPRPIVFRVLLCVGVLLPITALAARAGTDDAASAIESLTEAERGILDARLPGWAELPPEQQARIAKNVIRLRQLEGEERTRFLDRVRALERHREAHGRLPAELGSARNPVQRDLLRKRGVLVRAVGARLWASLTGEARAAIKSAPGRRGRAMAEVAFAGRLVAAQARAMAAAGEPIAIPYDLEPATQRRADQLRSRAAEGDAKARLKLAQLSVMLAGRALLDESTPGVALDAEALRRVGARVEALDPAVFRAAVAQLEKAAASPRSLERYFRAGEAARGAARDARLRRLLGAIEEARPALDADARLWTPAKRLERALRQALEQGPRAEGVPSPPGAGRGPR